LQKVCVKGVHQTKKPKMNPEVLKGKLLAEQLWWRLAKRIVEIAGNHYKWDDARWNAIAEVFLRPNDYQVTVEL
jgi:hypothetical protein